MERTCSFFYVMLYLLFYFEAEKVKKDVKTSINLIKMCYETCFFSWKVCQCPKSPYICNVFFIVLDLRLTKVGARRCSFFYVHTPTSSQPKEVLKQSPIHPKIEFQSFQHLTNHIIFLKRVIKHTNLLGLFAIFAESRTFAMCFS